MLRVEAHALFHRQRAHALGAVQLVGADGVHVHVGKVEGHAQKALHAVHVDEGAAGDGAFQALDVQKRAGLVVDLHAAYEAGAVVQGFLKRFIVERALFVHGKHAHFVAHFAQALEGGQHRGVFRGVDGHELFAVHALHRAEDGEVVGLRAAGGEDEFFPRRAQFFQDRLAAGAHLPEGRHRRAVDGRGVVPALLHALCHRADDERRGPRGGAVVQICFHTLLYAPSQTSAER